MKSMLFVIATTLFCFCVHAQPALETQHDQDSLQLAMAEERKAIAKQFENVALTSLVIHVENNRFGYYILADGQLIIEQKTIPSIAGTNGFISEEEAKRTAAFAIAKMKQGEMPPSITINDLEVLKITFGK